MQPDHSKVRDKEHYRSSMTSSASREDSTSTEGSQLPLLWGSIGVIGRDEEIQTISSALARIRDAPAEAVLVHGASGSGKSFLVKRVVESKTKQAPYLVGYGKCDQNSGSIVPYEAITAAVSNVCEAVALNPIKRASVKEQIMRDLLEQEIDLLLQMIPAAGNLLNRHHEADLPAEESVLDDTTAMRFMNLFRRFLQTLASSDEPLILFLDDLQWSDEASRALLESMTHDTKLFNILLLGTVRDGESTTFAIDTHAHMKHARVECRNLSHEAVTEMVAGALSSMTENRQVRALGKLVHRRCDGNPFFIMQFVESLQRDKLLWYSETTHSFEWNMEGILSQTSATANVVDVLVGKIAKLSPSSKALLMVFACIGHSIEETTLQSLLSHNTLAENLARIVGERSLNTRKALRETRQVGLVEQAQPNGQYKFVHDRIQQAALRNLQESQHQASIISTIGHVLLTIFRSAKGEDWMLFSSVNLLTKHRGSFGRGALAYLCLDAAKRAFAQAAFKSAAAFADSGSIALGTEGWKDYYEIQVALYSISVEADFGSGNWDNCEKRIETIKNCATKVEDTFRCFNVSVKMKLIEEDWEGCIRECMRGTAMVGVSFPRKPSTLYLLRLFAKVKRLVNGRTPQELADSLPVCKDDKIVEALSLITDAVTASYWMSENNLFCCMCAMSLKLTIKYGKSVFAPFAFTCYGLVLMVSGALEQSYEFGATAIRLSEQTGHDMARTEVGFHILNNHLRNPIRTTAAGFASGEVHAREKGASHMAAPAALQAVATYIFSGRTLREIKVDADRYWEQMNEYKQKAFLRQYAPTYQLLHILMDPDSHDGSLSGEFYNDHNVVALLVDKSKTIDIKVRAEIWEANHARVALLYILGFYNLAKNDIKRHQHIRERVGQVVFKLLHAVVCALNELACARQSKKQTASIGTYLREIKSHDRLGSPDVPAFMAFIEAERLSLKKRVNVTHVLQRYHRAIELLQSGQFYLLEAKALERLGDFLYSNSEYRAQGIDTIRRAWIKYETYGAVCMRIPLRDRYAFDINDKRAIELQEKAPVEMIQ